MTESKQTDVQVFPMGAETTLLRSHRCSRLKLDRVSAAHSLVWAIMTCVHENFAKDAIAYSNLWR